MRRLLACAFACIALVACTPPAPSPTYLLDLEFNGSSVPGVLQPNWLGANDTTVTKPVNGAELSCYDPKQVTVTGGALVLSAVQRACDGYAYASGLVNTHGRFAFHDGRIEARIWLAGGATIANWPAFWTNGNRWPNDGENDIMEGLSGRACYHYHSPSGGPGACPAGVFTGWHTYAADIRGTTVTYFYDGVKVGTLTAVDAPHYIVANLGIGGYGGARAVPSQMRVEYLRVSP